MRSHAGAWERELSQNLLHFVHLDRTALLGGEQRGFQHALRLIGVLEIGDRHGRRLRRPGRGGCRRPGW